MNRSISPFVTASFLWAGYTDSLEDTLLEMKHSAKAEQDDNITENAGSYTAATMIG